MNKFSLFLMGFVMSTLLVRAQIPTITSFSPSSGPVGTTVTITGTNFSTTLGNNIVYFGAVRANTIVSATATQLEVVVPAGAMYQPISVTVGGLKGSSAMPFVVAFDGSGINSSSFATRVNFTTGADPAYVALGDLDGDGKIDVATPNNASIVTTSVFRNLSTGPGSISFTAKSDITVGSNPISARIGDIDGDGLPDLVVANSAGGSYSIYRNTSTTGNISFAAKVDITFTTAIPYDIAIGDIDGDGKNDLAVVNNGGIELSIYRNTSSVGSISFAPKVSYFPTEAPVSVSTADLDGDGKLDIAVASFFGTSSNYISLFRNTSTPGTISLAPKVDVIPGSQPRDVKIGDLDGDGKADLAVANGSSGTMSVFRNTSSVGSLSFATRIDHTAGSGSISVSMGDIDGDAKVDVAIANFTSGTVSVFKNNSTSGNINFATKVDFTTGTQPRCVFIADHDGDGKQDLTTANFGNDTFSVFRNISKLNQSISFSALATKTFGDAPFTVSATASSGLTPIVFTSDNAAVATVSGNTVTIVGGGTCNIIASQDGNTEYNAAPQVAQILVVNKVNQSVTFGSLAARTMGDAPFSLTASASSSLIVSYTSSNTSVATISGSTVTLVGVGTTTITASQMGNNSYNPATSVQQILTVNKGNQTISFGALPGKAFGDAPFALTATSSSGLPITYTSSNPAVATISGSTVTLVGVGTTNITALQAGDANFNAATNVQRTLTVNKGDQTITFNVLPAKNFGDPAFTLTATASSSLPISYTSSNPAVATISGNTVIVVGVGTTTITASQSGNTNYNAAINVQQTLTVAPANQTITFAALPTKAFNDIPFSLSATASSGLAIIYSSSNTSVATISGNIVTILSVGTTTITASQGGNANFNAATNVQQTLIVNKADQTISFGSLPNKTFGDMPFTVTATTSSSLPVSFASSNQDVASVSGNTITIVGGGTTTITATQGGDANYNNAPNVSQTLTVDKATQTLSFNALTAKTFGDDPFILSATSSSGLPVTFVSSNTAVATIAGNTVSIVGGGTTTITAIQTGDNNYQTVSENRVLDVAKANQTITFSNIPDKTVGDPAFVLTANTTSSLPASFSTVSNKITINGDQVDIVSEGRVTVKATQPGNTNYNPASSVEQSFCIKPAKPTITLSNLISETPTLASSAATGNQWYRNDVLIAGATNKVLTATEVGTYKVRSTVDDCVSDFSDEVVLVVTSLEENGNQISLYPNPTAEWITISLNQLNGSKQISIVNTQGSVKESIDVEGNEATFNVAAYATGVYFVKVKTKNSVRVLRFVKR